MENASQIVLTVGGGFISLQCQKCGERFATEKVPFPGKKEDEFVPRQKLHVAQRSHLQTCK